MGRVWQKCVKKHDSVICPPNLNFPDGAQYSLLSILNHVGSSPESGHYTLIMFDAKHKSFLFLDDAKTEEDFQMNEEIDKLSYIVMYVKK